MHAEAVRKGSYQKSDERRIRALQRMLDEQGPVHFSRLLKEAVLREIKKTLPATTVVTEVDKALDFLASIEHP